MMNFLQFYQLNRERIVIEPRVSRPSPIPRSSHALVITTVAFSRVCPTINDTHGARGTRAAHRNETGAQACNGIYYENSRNCRRRGSRAIRLYGREARGDSNYAGRHGGAGGATPKDTPGKLQPRPRKERTSRANENEKVGWGGDSLQAMRKNSRPRKKPRRSRASSPREDEILRRRDVLDPPRIHVAGEPECREYLSSTSSSRHAGHAKFLREIRVKNIIEHPSRNSVAVLSGFDLYRHVFSLKFK